jgi:hypothetical protein
MNAPTCAHRKPPAAAAAREGLAAGVQSPRRSAFDELDDNRFKNRFKNRFNSRFKNRFKFFTASKVRTQAHPGRQRCCSISEPVGFNKRLRSGFLHAPQGHRRHGCFCGQLPYAHSCAPDSCRGGWPPLTPPALGVCPAARGISGMGLISAEQRDQSSPDGGCWAHCPGRRTAVPGIHLTTQRDLPGPTSRSTRRCG